MLLRASITFPHQECHNYGWALWIVKILLSHFNYEILQIISGKRLFLAYKGCLIAGRSTCISSTRRHSWFNRRVLTICGREKCFVRIKLYLHHYVLRKLTIMMKSTFWWMGLLVRSVMDINVITLMMLIVKIIWKIIYDSMSEGRNGEGNDIRNFCIPSKGRCSWWGVECDLSNDAKVFIASGPVIACDPRRLLLIISLVRIMWVWVFCIAQVMFQ